MPRFGSPFRTYQTATLAFVWESGTRRSPPAGGAVWVPLSRGSPALRIRPLQDCGTDFGTVVLVSTLAVCHGLNVPLPLPLPLPLPEMGFTGRLGYATADEFMTVRKGFIDLAVGMCIDQK